MGNLDNSFVIVFTVFSYNYQLHLLYEIFNCILFPKKKKKKKKKRKEKEHGALREKCPNTEFLSVFSPNTEKYGP